MTSKLVIKAQPVGSSYVEYNDVQVPITSATQEIELIKNGKFKLGTTTHVEFASGSTIEGEDGVSLFMLFDFGDKSRYSGLENIDTSEATSFYQILKSARSVPPEINNWNTSKVENFALAFSGANIDFDSLEWDASNATTGVNNDYGTAAELGSVSCGLIFQKEAAGCVEAIAPQVQVTSGDVSVIYQGDVILGRLAMGADYLNPAASVELYVGASAPSAF